MDLIEKSRIVHKSLHPKLKMLPPLLSSDTIKSIHSVSHRKRGHILESDPEFNGVVRAKARSNKKSETLAGLLDEVEWGYREKWADGGDHFLLKEIFERGLVPTSSWSQMPSSDEPPELKSVYEVAKRRGYNVPDSYPNVPHGEAELFYAAMYMAIEYRYNCFRWGKGDVLHQQSWRNEISSITGQFVIPDPLVEWKWPYVVDQLWIINNGGRTARLIAIEVDGDSHLNDDRKVRDRERNVKLNALGYQIIHVNEAWCRIDPFRVVAEVLRVIGLCPDFADAMVGGNLSSPDDYICEACGKPMIRFEDDSIKEVFEGRDSRLVHKSCSDEILEGIYQGDSRFSFSSQ